MVNVENEIKKLEIIDIVLHKSKKFAVLFVKNNNKDIINPKQVKESKSFNTENKIKSMEEISEYTSLSKSEITLMIKYVSEFIDDQVVQLNIFNKDNIIIEVGSDLINNNEKIYIIYF